MSGEDDPKEPINEDYSEDDRDPDIKNRESSHAPQTPSLPGNVPRGEVCSLVTDASKPPTNGEEVPLKSAYATTGKQSRDSVRTTPPRCDSPQLRKLLTSPSKLTVPSALTVAQLQGVANVISEAAGQGGIVPVAVQGTESRGGEVPKTVQTSDVVPGAGQGTEAAGGGVPEAVPNSEAVQGAQRASVQETAPSAGKGNIPETKRGTAAEEYTCIVSLLTEKPKHDITKVVSESVEVAEAKGGEVSIPMQNPVAEEEMTQVTERNVPEPDAAAAADSVPAKNEIAEDRLSLDATDEQMQISENHAASDPTFKKPAVASRIQNMKGRLGEMKLDEAEVLDSPKRRSARLAHLQRSSGSPSPKKERKSSRTQERFSSEERVTTRGQKGRLGSTSSNSEMEGSGDESKGKRVSRRDSKK